jgi:hypothetical protein
MTEYQRLRENLQKLRLTKIDEYLPGYVDSGRGEGKPLVTALRELTDEEIRFRDERAADMNFKLSNFPGRKTFDDFDFAYQPSVDRARIMDLRTLRFLEEAENVIFIGSSGVGKTHLATAIGIEASSSHVATYFITFRNLVERLRKAAAEGREEQTIKNVCKYGLLIIGGGLRPPLLLSLQHQQKRPQIGVRHRGYVVPREHEKIPFREIGGRPEGKGHYCQTTRSRGASQLPLVVWRWDYTTAGFLPFICSYIRFFWLIERR